MKSCLILHSLEHESVCNSCSQVLLDLMHETLYGSHLRAPSCVLTETCVSVCLSVYRETLVHLVLLCMAHT